MRSRIEFALGLPTLRIFLAGFLGLLAGVCASAQCRPPDYREGQVWENSKSTVLMAISIPLTGFAPAKLVCLAQTFRGKFPGRDSITILIFSSADAAKTYRPYQPDYQPANDAEQQKRQSHAFWVSQLHGFYSYKANKDEEYLDIRPKGSEGEGPYDTKIPLPAKAKPHCHLEINDRCLLELREIRYPSDTLNAGVSGTVTLTGVILRNGRMTRIQTGEAADIPIQWKKLFVSEAIANLHSWRFEEAQRRIPFRISFDYTIETSHSLNGATEVQFDLPNKVMIRGNPPQ